MSDQVSTWIVGDDQPPHDSRQWRILRNFMLKKWIKDPIAIRWLLDLWDACEVIDDLIDKDREITDQRIYDMLLELVIDCPSNPFFIANYQELIPVMRFVINTWVDSVTMEKDGSDHSLHHSYVTRGAYTGLTQVVVELVHGRERMQALSYEIIKFFTHEPLDQYMEKIRGNIVEERE